MQIYPTSALGSLRVTWESMQLGNLEGGNWDTVTPAMMVPQYAVSELPFIFRDLDHVHKVFDGPIGQDLEKQLLDKAKVRTSPSTTPRSGRSSPRSKAINNLADMKGLKIRVPEAQNYVRCMQSWAPIPPRSRGANCTPHSRWGWWRASRTRQRPPSTPSSTNRRGSWRTRAISLLPNPFLCSERWFSKLPKNVQQAIVEAGKESLAWQRAEAPNQREVLREEARGRRRDVHQPGSRAVREGRGALLSRSGGTSTRGTS